MYQGTTLNFSEQPVARGQTQPGPTTVASSGDVSAVQSDVDALNTRVTANETDIAALQGQFSSLGDYADDAAAATAGVAVGELYRNGSVLMIRVS